MATVLYTVHTTVQLYSREVEKIKCPNHAVKYYWTRLEYLTKTLHLSEGRRSNQIVVVTLVIAFNVVNMPQ